MTLMRDVVTDTCLGVEIAETPQGLAVIHDAPNAAVVWRRKMLPSFQSWIDGLEPAQLPKARLIIRPENVREAVRQVCDIRETPDSPERDRLIDDVTALSELFAELMQAPYLRVRLDVIQTNACRKFHVDAITARLICTYRGTGTQYGTPAADGSDPRRISTAPTGTPIILRGTHWPEQPRSGLLHRSPPIEGTDETRLVLVLDPVTDLEHEV